MRVVCLALQLHFPSRTHRQKRAATQNINQKGKTCGLCTLHCQRKRKRRSSQQHNIAITPKQHQRDTKTYMLLLQQPLPCLLPLLLQLLLLTVLPLVPPSLTPLSQIETQRSSCLSSVPLLPLLPSLPPLLLPWQLQPLTPFSSLPLLLLLLPPLLLL